MTLLAFVTMDSPFKNRLAKWLTYNSWPKGEVFLTVYTEETPKKIKQALLGAVSEQRSCGVAVFPSISWNIRRISLTSFLFLLRQWPGLNKAEWILKFTFCELQHKDVGVLRCNGELGSMTYNKSHIAPHWVWILRTAARNE